MNKIIYPSKDEIDKQISDIISKSGLFEDASKENDVLEYTEFAPVNKHKQTRKTIYTVAAAAAVVIIAAAAVNHMGGSLSNGNGGGSLEPMNSVSDDGNSNDETQAVTDSNGVIVNTDGSTTQVSDGLFSTSYEEVTQGVPANVSDDVYKQVMGSSLASIASKMDMNTRISVWKNSYAKTNYYDNGEQVWIDYNINMPMVIYKNNHNQLINDYYTAVMNGATTQLVNKWNSDAEILYGWDQETLQKVAYSYTTEMVNTYAGNPDVISILMRYDAKYYTTARQAAFGCVVSKNFNAQSGYQITLDDIFTDPEAGKKELFTSLQRMISAQYDDSELSENYRSANFDLENGSNLAVSGINGDDCNWHFGEEGIVMICNNMLAGERNIVEYSGSIANDYESQKTYVIPYEALSYLKSEYAVK